MSDEQVELLPCPFCGNDGSGPIEDALQICETDMQGTWKAQMAYSVQCDKCTATMGYSESEDEAVEAWNTRAAIQPTPQEWQPIETAPRDGSTVLVCLPRMMNLIVRASYSTVHKYWRTDMETDGGINNPTFFHTGDFWCALPSPPQEARHD